jgi:hypothetical protein
MPTSVMRLRFRAAPSARVVMFDASSLRTPIDACHPSSTLMNHKTPTHSLTHHRQVQDLERQLFETRQQLDRLRAQDSKHDGFDGYASDGTPSLSHEMPIVGKSPRRMLKARTPSDLNTARLNLVKMGKGVLRPPVTRTQSRSAGRSISNQDIPSLPPRQSGDRYLKCYVESIHCHYPVLHWKTFYTQYLTAYGQRDESLMRPEEIAVLYVVLACGALYTGDKSVLQEAQDNLTRAVSMLNFWEDDVTTSQAIVAFLSSIFLTEINRKSAAWIWAGSAIRAAQDLGLHIQGGQWSPIEGEMRKRIWYSFYVWDRYVS